MNKKHGKQATLFQTWSRSQDVAKTSDPKIAEPSTSTKWPPYKARQTEDNHGVILLDAEDQYDDEKYSRTNVQDADSTSLPGFDSSAGDSWIYPTNYPVRDYQYNIVHAALFKNTLVTLPTGLGKTFIAAVLMFNFYRWYPSGKVVFMAPTKPLVAQQIEACYNVMGIPQQDTIEMTGSMAPADRKSAWMDKRVFFLTPQVLTNDLSRNICPAKQVKCLVIDEAHKALGNHAYCQVIKELLIVKSQFRILALSATPGSDIKSVQQVIDNLNIAHIEIRSEESIDIQPYTHHRVIEKIVVKLGDELSSLVDTYLDIISQYTNRLVSRNVMPKRNPKSLSKFMLLKYRDGFRQDPPANLQRSHYGSVEGDFALCMSMFHAYELLQLHGSRSFYNFLQGMLDGKKGQARAGYELMRNSAFTEMMEELESQYKDESFNRSLLNNTQAFVMQKSNKFVMSHPKMNKLQELLTDYFEKCKRESADSRVMVFSQYRDSVLEIAEMLNLHKPLIKAMSFIGQKSKTGKNGRGFTQKEQIKVVKDFKNGGYNTLVCTCVGEEGLDIGEVDLIVCYDAPKSPIRLVQRMGRTGRKRKGQIVMLVTEGKEEQMYNQSLYSKKSIHKALSNGNKLRTKLENNPRLVPAGFEPTCVKLHMTMNAYEAPANGRKKNAPANQRISSMFKNSASTKSSKRNAFLTTEEFAYWNDNYKVNSEVFKLSSAELSCLRTKRRQSPVTKGEAKRLPLNDWLPWQTDLQPHGIISHSTKTTAFVDAIKFIEIQHEIGSNDDPYGLEMVTYLNRDDVLDASLKQCQPVAAAAAVCTNVNSDSEDDFPVYECLGSTPSPKFNQTLDLNRHDEHELDFPLVKSPPPDDEIFDDGRDDLSPIDIKEIVFGVKNVDGDRPAVIPEQKYFLDDNDDSFLLQACDMISFEKNVLELPPIKSDAGKKVVEESNQSCTMSQLLELANQETQDWLRQQPSGPSEKNVESLNGDDDFVPPSPMAVSKSLKLRPSQNAPLHRKSLTYRTDNGKKPGDEKSHLDGIGESLFTDDESPSFVEQKSSTPAFKVPFQSALPDSKPIRKLEGEFETSSVHRASFITKPEVDFPSLFSPDDDFESDWQSIKGKTSVSRLDEANNTSVEQTPVFKNKRIRQLDFSSSEGESTPVKRKTKKPKIGVNKFIDDEADCEEELSFSGDECEASQMDDLEASFINDASQSVIAEDSREKTVVDHTAMYLRSVRSPVHRGKFKLSYKPYDEMNVFSQLPEEDDDSYEHDSFCVENSAVEYDDDSSPVAKKAPSKKQVKGPQKRKRIIQVIDSSSEDEAKKSSPVAKTFASPTEPDRSFMPPNAGPSNDAISNAATTREQRLRLQKIKREEYLKKHGIASVDVGSVTSRPKPNLGNSSNTSVVDCSRIQPHRGAHNSSRTSDSSMQLPKVGDKVTVVVDTREVGSAQTLISNLKNSCEFHITVHQLDVSDYILSNRAAVLRKSFSDFSSGANKKKLVDEIRQMCELFDRPYVIVEKDRPKNGEVERPLVRSKYFNLILAYLAQTHVKVLHSYSQENSATLIQAIVNQENKKGLGIKTSMDLNPHQQMICKLYRSLPRISLVSAVNLVHSFPSFNEFCESSVSKLKAKGALSQSRAQEIYGYLRKNFNVDMLPKQ